MSIVKFRAGKVSYDAATKTATPLPIQGQIVLKHSLEDESFFSFEWSPKDNVVNIEKDEFLIIPGDASWSHVEECKTGRVFALEFLSSGARHLFWLQEVNDNDDDPSELSKKDMEIYEKLSKLFEFTEEDDEEEEEEEEEQPQPGSASEDKQADTVTQSIQHLALNDLLTATNIREALDKSSADDIERLYTMLPNGMEHNRDNLLKVLTSPYFKRSAANLTEGLYGGGSTISRALGVEYLGEGTVPFVTSLKKQSDKDRQAEDAEEEAKNN